MLCMAQSNNQAVFMYVYFLKDIALAQPKLSKIDEEDRGKRGVGRKFAEFCVVLKNNCGNIWKFKIFLVPLFDFALNVGLCVLAYRRERVRGRRKQKIATQTEQSNIIIYNTLDGRASVALYAVDGSVWLNQNQLAELFGTSIPNVSMHISNILKDRELDVNSVIKDFLTTAPDGKQL